MLSRTDPRLGSDSCEASFVQACGLFGGYGRSVGSHSELTRRRPMGALWVLVDPEFREQQFRDLVSFFQMRIARGDHGLDAERLVFAQPFGDRHGIANERGAGAAAHESD